MIERGYERLLMKQLFSNQEIVALLFYFISPIK
jgi:hypothetical protein